MKTFSLRLLAVCLALAATTSGLRSQTATPLRNPQELLQAVKAQNQKLLEQQTATMQKLDELLKTSQQLRAMARRT